jgi:CheY-like chemotaxis protein
MKQRVSILVVEDDSNVATVLKARLEIFGYEVCDVVSSGQRAIDSAMQHHPDLALMDILIEGAMDGIETAAILIKKLDVPVIFLTCLNDQQVMDRAIKANPYGFLTKPYDKAELQSSIEIALVKHQAAKERERLIAQLEKALLEVKRLSGLLPICASCKKIRDDQGNWQQIESYIQSHSEADFSHGICPDCAQRLYPDLYHKKGSAR